MGNCRSETKPKLKTSNVIDKPIVFSPDEIQLVQSTWDHVTDHKEFGVKAMISMFQTYSDARFKFIFAHGLETEAEMRANSQLTYHAAAVIGVIDRVVKDFESVNSNEFSDIIVLGSNHFFYGVRFQDFKVNGFFF
jgi:predicted class III extradiol MEMO1 family dioxygenase